MPIYQYGCARCGARTELRRAIAARDDAVACTCGAAMRRLFSSTHTNMNGALCDDPITRWQFAHLDDKAWSRSRWI